MFMTVSKTPPQGVPLCAVWSAHGGTDVAEPAGVAAMSGQSGDVCFAIAERSVGANVMGCEEIAKVPNAWAFRLDEVAFPVGAIAYRHTHTGSGWRHLVSGLLRIETDHSAQIIEPGMSWFEPANSPVRAVALHDSGVTRFVRAMVIPTDFVGRSTFQLCDPKDAELPRLQVTHRHFDHVP